MAAAAIWARRVREWRESGLSSPAFCAGRGYTPGALRHWAHRLAHAEGLEPAVPARIRVARVVRERSAASGSPIVVEVGSARISVPAGVDRDTLALVVEVLRASEGTS